MFSFKNVKALALAVVFVSGLTAAAALSFAADAPAKNAAAQKPVEMLESGWTKRCENKEGKNCEIFQLLAVKESKARVAEFALGSAD